MNANWLLICFDGFRLNWASLQTPYACVCAHRMCGCFIALCCVMLLLLFFHSLWACLLFLSIYCLSCALFDVGNNDGNDGSSGIRSTEARVWTECVCVCVGRSRSLTRSLIIVYIVIWVHTAAAAAKSLNPNYFFSRSRLWALLDTVKCNNRSISHSCISHASV